MEDYDQIDSTMDGRPFKAGRHAATLRRMLWREHLGLLPAQGTHDNESDANAQPPDVCGNDSLEGQEYEFVADPLSDKVWNMWTGQATTNTETFRRLFRADPDNHSMSTLSLGAFVICAPVVICSIISCPTLFHPPSHLS